MNMTMDKQPFEDVSPVKRGDFPANHVSLLEGTRKDVSINITYLEGQLNSHWFTPKPQLAIHPSQRIKGFVEIFHPWPTGFR